MEKYLNIDINYNNGAIMNRKKITIITILMLIITSTAAITSASANTRTGIIREKIETVSPNVAGAIQVKETFRLCRIESSGSWTFGEMVGLLSSEEYKPLYSLQMHYGDPNSTTTIKTPLKTVTIKGEHELKIERKTISENYALSIPCFIGKGKNGPLTHFYIEGIAIGVTVTYYKSL